jgi:hypothetical protein
MDERPKIIPLFVGCETYVEYVVVKTVGRVERRTGGAVFPWMVEAWLDFPRCEQTLRRDMAALARRGVLDRVGGEGRRQGYRVAQIPHGRMVA